jgi:hypothetical protein
MNKKIVLFIFLIASLSSKSQIEVVKLLGDKSDSYKLGYGAFLKLAFPVTETSDITAEAAFVFWFLNDGSGDGMLVTPAKVGYRYCFNGTGTGIYAEPQVGYNLYGVESNTKFTGFIWSAGIGYLFKRTRAIQFDIGLRYESIIYKGASLNYAALRLAHDLNFRRRDAD